MSKLKTIGYSLKDIAVIQAPVSYINHRQEANPFVEICKRNVYPIFVAPMASVVDENNYEVWIENNLTPVVPRSVQKSNANPDGITFVERMEIAKKTFVSISLNEATDQLRPWIQMNRDGIVRYICIDIAHGTLSELYKICKYLKETYKDELIIMTGNIANPDAYSFYADCGIDFVRVGIGSGSRCTTACATGIYYPMATLLDELNEARKSYALSHNGYAPTKLIADGGFETYGDIQKALCVGADYIMAGKMFAECEEACGQIIWSESEETCINGVFSNKSQDGLKRFRNYAGMSHRSSQKLTGGDGSKVSEGIVRPVLVKYSVKQWIENENSYLRSCMTYTNSHTISEMQKNAQVIICANSDADYRK